MRSPRAAGSQSLWAWVWVTFAKAIALPIHLTNIGIVVCRIFYPCKAEGNNQLLRNKDTNPWLVKGCPLWGDCETRDNHVTLHTNVLSHSAPVARHVFRRVSLSYQPIISRLTYLLTRSLAGVHQLCFAREKRGVSLYAGQMSLQCSSTCIQQTFTCRFISVWLCVYHLCRSIHNSIIVQPNYHLPHQQVNIITGVFIGLDNSFFCWWIESTEYKSNPSTLTHWQVVLVIKQSLPAAIFTLLILLF